MLKCIVRKREKIVFSFLHDILQLYYDVPYSDGYRAYYSKVLRVSFQLFQSDLLIGQRKIMIIEYQRVYFYWLKKQTKIATNPEIKTVGCV